MYKYICECGIEHEIYLYWHIEDKCKYYNCSSDTKSLYLEISFDRKNFRKTIDIFDIDINSTGIFKTITYLNDEINSKLKECAKQKADLDQLIDDLNICMEFV